MGVKYAGVYGTDKKPVKELVYKKTQTSRDLETGRI